jgi:hypothetical protein
LSYKHYLADEPDDIDAKSDEWNCYCNKAYNPWRKPNGIEPQYNDIQITHYKIRIKLKYDIIVNRNFCVNQQNKIKVNGKHRFHTQNGSIWFERECLVSLLINLPMNKLSMAEKLLF